MVRIISIFVSQLKFKFVSLTISIMIGVFYLHFGLLLCLHGIYYHRFLSQLQLFNYNYRIKSHS
ncbi:hypothetical protein BC833DRAFT_610754 [Globomyces pollinis-pini]|nr:hypothetical protein BC833DRAFT_610754 [Globomyces pollinis-pini]